MHWTVVNIVSILNPVSCPWLYLHSADSTDTIGHGRNCYIPLRSVVLTPWSAAKHSCCYSNHFVNRNEVQDKPRLCDIRTSIPSKGVRVARKLRHVPIRTDGFYLGWRQWWALNAKRATLQQLLEAGVSRSEAFPQKSASHGPPAASPSPESWL